MPIAIGDLIVRIPLPLIFELDLRAIVVVFPHHSHVYVSVIVGQYLYIIASAR